MKKILMMVAVMALVSTASFAQATFGAKAGLNFANMSYDVEGLSISPDSKTGVVIGGFARFSLTESFALQPELLYSAQGAKMEDEKVELNYISVPVMAKYYFGGFNVQAGPQLGFLMSAKADGEDVKDMTKGMDFGLSFGAGYDLEMGVGFDLRYYVGMSNIDDSESDVDPGYEMGDIETKNKGLQITVSYAF